MLQDYFSWWTGPFDFLFQSWHVTTATALVFTAIGTVPVCCIYIRKIIFVND